MGRKFTAIIIVTHLMWYILLNPLSNIAEKGQYNALNMFICYEIWRTFSIICSTNVKYCVAFVISRSVNSSNKIHTHISSPPRSTLSLYRTLSLRFYRVRMIELGLILSLW